MGQRFTKNISSEHGGNICGKRFRLLSGVSITENTGHTFSYDQYILTDSSIDTDISIREGTIISVRNVYIGNNIPYGGKFIMIIADIGEYIGVVSSDLFTPVSCDVVKNLEVVKIQPKPEFLEEVLDGGFEYDDKMIPMPSLTLDVLRRYTLDLLEAIERSNILRRLPVSTSHLDGRDIPEHIREIDTSIMTEWDYHRILQRIYVESMAINGIIDESCLDESVWKIDSSTQEPNTGSGLNTQEPNTGSVSNYRDTP